jgi:hypothetical protein
MFSRSRWNNVATELLPSNRCCTVICLHSCYLTHYILFVLENNLYYGVHLVACFDFFFIVENIRIRTTVERFATVVVSVFECYAGHWPLSGVYFMYTSLPFRFSIQNSRPQTSHISRSFLSTWSHDPINTCFTGEITNLSLCYSIPLRLTSPLLGQIILHRNSLWNIFNLWLFLECETKFYTNTNQQAEWLFNHCDFR